MPLNPTLTKRIGLLRLLPTKALIVGIQGSTTTTVASIRGLAERLATVREFIAVIAAAGEEQSAATHEIAINVQHAATGTVSAMLSVTNGFGIGTRDDRRRGDDARCRCRGRSGKSRVGARRAAVPRKGDGRSICRMIR